MPKMNLNRWIERAPMQVARAGCATGVLGGKLIAAGGTYWRDGKKFWCADVDIFDPAANRWEPTAPMPQPHGDAPAAVLGDTCYVFGGGADGLPSHSVVAYQAGNWSVRPEMALPAPRRSSIVAVLDQTFYLLGGIAGTWTDFASITPTFWSYTSGRGWQSLPSLPGVTRFNTAVGAVGGRIIVAGGCSASGGQVQNLDDIFAYEPKTQTWALVGKLPVPSRGATGLSDGDRLIYFGGYTDKFEATIWSIDPVSGQVEAAGQLPCGLADTRFLRTGSSVYGLTGENGIKMRFPGTIEASLA